MPSERQRGFTLIELAIVLVVIGILLGLGVALLGPLTKQAQFKRSRERVKACKEAIIGFVAASRRLPDSTEFQSICNEKDAWGQGLVYIPDDASIMGDGTTDRVDMTTVNTCCSQIPSDMAVNDRAYTGGTDNYKTEVAFVVLSKGEDRTQNGSLAPGNIGGTDYQIYTIEEYSDTYDDIIEYATVYELRDVIRCEPLQIVTTSLPQATEDSAYSAKVIAKGGCPDYTFSVSGGSLPGGLNIASDGTISGTVDVCTACPAGSLTTCTDVANFTIRVRDDVGTTVTQGYSIVTNPQTLQILTSNLPDAYNGISYNANIIGSGGNISGYNFTVGGLPSGLSATSSSDCNGDPYNECSQISGTPSATCGDYSVTVTLNDGCNTASKVMNLHLYNPLSCSLTGTGTDNGDGTWTYTLDWTVTGQATLGQINGVFSPQSGTCTTISTSSTTNTATGSCTTDPLSTDTTFVLKVTDTCGDSAQCQYTATVGGGGGGGSCSTPMSLTPASGTTFNATVGTAFSQTITVSGGLPPYTNTDCTNNCSTYGLTLSCSSTDATISGTPTSAGTCTFTVAWQDSCSPPNSVSGTYTVNIAPACPPFTGWSSTLPDAYNCQSYSGSITVIGGVSPYSWSLTSGALPNGISFCTGNTSATCDITGSNVLDAPGTYSFTVQVQDSCTTPGPQSTSNTFSINVVDACYTSGISVRNETGEDRCYWREGDTFARVWRRNRTITIDSSNTLYHIGNIVGFNCVEQCTTTYCEQKGYDTDGDCRTRMRPNVCQFQDR